MCLSLIDVEMFTAACVCTLYNHFLPIKSSRSIAINAMILHTLILGYWNKYLLKSQFVTFEQENCCCEKSPHLQDG